MTKNVIQAILLIGFMVLCFALGAWLTGVSGKRKKTKQRSRSPDTLPLSAFSTFDHPALADDPKDFDPLAEAEVFLAYGKKARAREALEAALAQGRVSQEAIDAFWARH
ncbi:MAG: hypothetical protein ACM3X0_13155 [Bacteroidota bacterium]